MSEAFYEGLDISRAFENENSKKKEIKISILNKAAPPDKLEEYREFTLFADEIFRNMVRGWLLGTGSASSVV